MQVVELKLPYPDGESVNVTVPVGVELPLPPISATVTWQVVPWLTTIVDGEHTTVVLVALKDTVSVKGPLLPEWSASPP